jgi:hypothetical protein
MQALWEALHGGKVIPIGPGLGPEGAQGAAGNQVALDVEGVVGGGMHRDETLGGSRRFEPLHLAFSSAERLMGFCQLSGQVEQVTD